MVRIREFLKKEAVLCVSAVLVVISAFFVPPDYGYIKSIDFRVILLLFCLMCVVNGFKETGLFERIAKRCFSRVRSEMILMLVLVMLCFFSAMFITNDVALITFVPFTIMLLPRVGMESRMKFVIIMQTIGANLGSMLTPVGNPQNLFLYSVSGMNIVEFIKVSLPYWGLSMVLICAVIMVKGRGKRKIESSDNSEKIKCERKKEIFYGILFLICLLTVAYIIDYRITFIIVLTGVIIVDRRVLKGVDYCLLITFVCFFIFIGNMGRITYIREMISGILKGNEIVTGIVTSQFISNVPAAILLSEFTENYRGLIIGVNAGGLGTLIASLASLISYKFYAVTEKADIKRYMLEFTGWNAAFLAVLMIAGILME